MTDPTRTLRWFSREHPLGPEYGRIATVVGEHVDGRRAQYNVALNPHDLRRDTAPQSVALILAEMQREILELIA